MNSNMKTHLAVAKFAPDVFRTLRKVERLWNDKKIEQAPKTPIRQTHVSGLLCGTDHEKIVAMNKLIADGYKAFKKVLAGMKKSLTEDESRDANGTASNAASEGNHLVRELRLQLEEKEERIARLEAENRGLREKLARCAPSIFTKPKTSTSPKSVKPKTSTTPKSVEPKTSTSPKSVMPKTASTSPKSVKPKTSTSPKSVKPKTSIAPKSVKQKLESEDCYLEGEAVKALWKDKTPKLTGFYDAVVKNVTDNVVSVQFKDGMEAELSHKCVRKL